ncbi:hypothetical protein AB0D34_36750 [Streptomyces sp. NPDC048420]|uniref:hypothetical protein n=1 Tax=Streptomyces sp. NPDC048420 TaxID=3155755 RepID=UPI003415B39E
MTTVKATHATPPPRLPVRDKAAALGRGWGGVSPMLTRLAAERATGVLVRERGTLHLADGKVVHAESPTAPGAHVLLAAHGTLDPDVWRQALAESIASTGGAGTGTRRLTGAEAVHRAGRRLVAGGLLPPGALEMCRLTALYDAAYFALAPSSTPGRFRYGTEDGPGDFTDPDSASGALGSAGTSADTSGTLDARGASARAPEALGTREVLDTAATRTGTPGPLAGSTRRGAPGGATDSGLGGTPTVPHTDPLTDSLSAPPTNPPTTPGTPHPVPVADLERETLRRRDLLHRIWPDALPDEAPLTREYRLALPLLPARRQAVLALVNGVRTASDIARELGRPAFHTLVDIRRLVAAGAVSPCPPMPTADPLCGPMSGLPGGPEGTGPPVDLTGAVAPVDPHITLLKRLRDALEAL